jgi:hypothetical protein
MRETLNKSGPQLNVFFTDTGNTIPTRVTLAQEKSLVREPVSA